MDENLPSQRGSLANKLRAVKAFILLSLANLQGDTAWKWSRAIRDWTCRKYDETRKKGLKECEWRNT